MGYQQELSTHYAAVHLRLYGPMRRQFIPVPVTAKPAPIAEEPAPAELMTENERIVACIRLARELIADASGYKKTFLVQRAVASIYGVSVDDLTGPRRFHRFLEPRHIAMTIARALLPYSLSDIARAFGGRDHTTAINAVRKFGAKVAAIIEREDT